MKHIVILFFLVFISTVTFSQDMETASAEQSGSFWNKVKLSGYLQMQYQYGEKDASLRVGDANSNIDESFDRIGIRRGRLKLAYDNAAVQSVFQLDITERGISVRDIYFGVKDLWSGTNILKLGVFNRPFGDEISYSSSQRESPEHSTIFKTLFPEKRDLGVALTLQANETSCWNFLKLEAGLFAGNGIKQEIDNRKDFIGHLSAAKNIKNNITWGVGVSYYNGGVYQGTNNVFTMDGTAFVANSDVGNEGKFAKREYIGADAQFSVVTLLGTTQLRAEYIVGQQPGTELSAQSPNSSVLPNSDTYIRKINGGYVIFVQSIGKLPFQAVAKYDIFDPNTTISGNEIGMNNTSITDLSQHTFGFGGLWNLNPDMLLMAFYEINNYEKTASLPYVADLKRNVFTLRLQYKF